MIHNVIPNEVHLRGTIRSHGDEVRRQLWVEVERALQLSEVLGGSYELKILKGYPALYNAPRRMSWLREVAQDMVAETAVLDTQFGMGAEDFAYMAQKAPGAMFMLGAATPDGVVEIITWTTLISTKACCPWARRCWLRRRVVLWPVS